MGRGVLRPAIRVAAFAAASCFALLWWVEPTPDPVAWPLSAYALTEAKGVWQACLIFSGVATFLSALLPYEDSAAIKRRSLWVSAAALVGLSVVHTDPWFPWEHLPTIRGAIHVLFAGASMGAFGVFAAVHAVTAGRGQALARMIDGIFAVTFVATIVSVGVLVLLGRSPGFVGASEWLLLGLALAGCFAGTLGT